MTYYMNANTDSVVITTELAAVFTDRIGQEIPAKKTIIYFSKPI